MAQFVSLAVVLLVCLLAITVWQTEATGQVFAGGYNNFGQFGYGTRAATVPLFQNITGNLTLAHGSNLIQPKVIKIAVSKYASAALFENGTVATAGLTIWGDPDHVGFTETLEWVPLLPSAAWPDNEPFSDIWASQHGFFALTRDTNQLFCWGYNTYGALGDVSNVVPPYTDFSNLTRVAGLSSPIYIEKIDCLDLGCVAVLTNGTILHWGFNDTLTSAPTTFPAQIAGVEAANISHVASCNTFVIFYSNTTDTFYQWGYFDGGWTASISELPARIGEFATKVVSSLYCGADTVYVLAEDGGVWAWGSNAVGEFGNGTWSFDRIDITLAELVPLNFTPRIFATVTYTTFAVHPDAGDVYGWGDVSYGILGSDGLDTAYSPRQLVFESENITNVIAVSGYQNAFFMTDASAYNPGTADPPTSSPVAVPVDPPVSSAPIIPPGTPVRKDLIVIYSILASVLVIALIASIL